MTDVRGKAPLTSLFEREGIQLSPDAKQGVTRWQAARMRSAPNLVFPGVNAASSTFFDAAAELIDWCGQQHANDPRMITVDGTQLCSIPGVMPSPAGIPPSDSRPILKEKFEARREKYSDEYWTALGRRAGLSDLGADVRLFREKAVYPAWFEGIAYHCATALWPGWTLEPIPIKRRSSMGAPFWTSDVDVKVAALQPQISDPLGMLQLVRAGKFKEAYLKYGWLRLFSAGYRGQLEGTIKGGGMGIATPKKERRSLCWDGAVRPMGRKFTELPPGWDDRIMQSRLAVRSRPLTQGNQPGDLTERAMVRCMSGPRITTWGEYFITTEPADIDAVMEGCIFVYVGDIGNNDWCQGRGVPRAMFRRIDQLFGGGGWLFDNLFRAPLIARADIREDAGSCLLSGSPFDPDQFDSHFEVATGNPGTAEVTHLHGVICRVTSQWLYERAEGLTHDDVDVRYVKSVLGNTTSVVGKGTGDNFMVGTKDPAYAGYAKDPDAYSPFASLDASDTYAGYIVMRDRVSGAYDGATINAANLFDRTLFHDRSLDSPLRGNPVVGLKARRTRLAGHDYGAIWLRKLDDVCKRHFGETADAMYEAFVSREGSTSLAVPVINLIEMAEQDPLNAVEWEYLEDPDVIQWKYDPKRVRPELLDYMYISVPKEATMRILKAIETIGPQAFEVERN